MSDSLLKIAGGTLYDPANGIDGEVRDIWIKGGKVVASPNEPSARPDRTIDATGLVVMPGGIDMHCHIAGPKVNTARKLQPEMQREADPQRRTDLLRSGTSGSVPSTFTTAYQYLGLGYTTAIDAAIPPLMARHAHEEFADTPCIDKAFLTLIGNNHYALRAIADGDRARLRGFIAWLLGASKGYGLKIVNPGGVEMWKQKQAGDVSGLDDLVDGFGVTPRQIVSELAHAADELALPHPVHIHCNKLGIPGNWRTTLATMQALDGHRGHFTHIQFHSYGGDGDEASFSSQVARLATYVNEHPNLTVDVGQVLFGRTTSMTGDGPVGYYLHKLLGGKWVSRDVECEGGCGISPIEYKNKSLIHSLQWAIGLEWYLLVNDPWRIAMSTDHPNGGSFLAYPQIIRLLMDRSFRQEMLLSLPGGVRELGVLADLKREYTLNEICIVTRAAPARMLGLKHKGHLAVGADADVTIYSPHANRQTMFELPRYVLKAGEVLVDDCEIRGVPDGRTLYIAPDYDRGIEKPLEKWFNEHYSLRFANYAVGDEEAPQAVEQNLAE